MSLRSMLNMSGTLYRPTIGQGASKGITGTLVPVADAENVPCSVDAASAGTQMLYRQQNMTVTHTIWFETNIGARPGDQFRVTEDDGTVHKFNVRGMSGGLFNRFQSPYKLDCQEVL